MRHGLLPTRCFQLLLAVLFSSAATAAPPKLDYLFPAGAQRGATIEVTAAGTFERWPVKAWCDGKGIDVKPGKTSGKLTVTVAKEVEPGTYWLRLYDDDGASIARPFIVGVLPEVLEEEPNDDPKKPQVLASSQLVVNGRLGKPGDVDTFAVKLTKGQTLVASLEAHRTLRSPMDGVLQILSAAGFVLDQNDDYHEIDPQIAFTAPKDGTYLVRTFAFPALADSTIGFAGKETFVYRLTLTTGPWVEYANPLAVSRTGPTTVELVGWNISEELRKFRVTPRDGVEALKLFDSRLANPFFVRVEPHPVLVKTQATRAQPMAIGLPVTITGRLDKPGDVDVYQFDAKKGQKVAFRIEARTLGFPLDPVLRLTDAAGKSIAQAKASAIGTDASLDFTAPGDGSYRIEVSDLHGAAGMRYAYRLRAGPIAADFEVKVAGDNFTLLPGKPLEIPVTITRVGGFSQDIAFSFEGLPKTIEIASTAKGITLRTTDKASFTGPVRIVGKAKDGTSRFALATVAEFNRVTDSLWLSVLTK